jgi:hypothetical protein
MNDWNAQGTRRPVEGIDRLDDLARPGCGTGAVGIVGEVPLVQIDANDGGVRERGEFLKASRQDAALPINIDVHFNAPSCRVAHVKGKKRLSNRTCHF